MARDDSSAGLVIVAFALGALTGAAVALLMAPAAGDETRRALGEKAREGRETVNTAIERGRQAYQQARAGDATTSGGAVGRTDAL